MPILPGEPDTFPADLLQQDLLPDEAVGRWWALYTLPRREKELMRRLRSLEIPHFAPLITRRHHSPAGRVRLSYVPLFPSYVFLRANQSQRLEILKTNCICRCLEIEDQLRLVHDLRQIQLLVRCGAPLTPESRIQPGTRVRVSSGVLEGVEGVVVQRRGRQRLLIAVQFLQQGASVLLEDCQVEPLD